MDETSPIYERGLRNALEHYDEALDDFLLTAGAGNFFPDPQVGQIPSPQEVPSHHFKLLDPGTSRFVLLGELYEFGLIQKEVDRIHAEATRMDANGCRL